MINVIDRQKIDLLCLNLEYAISVASIQTVITKEGNLERRCIDPMALARFGKMQREHKDRNRLEIDTDFELVDGVTY